jgi:hypothetical protein
VRPDVEHYGRALDEERRQSLEPVEELRIQLALLKDAIAEQGKQISSPDVSGEGGSLAEHP